MILNLGIRHRVLKCYQTCSNDETGLTFTIFMTWSNLFLNASAWVKAYTTYSRVFPFVLIQHVICTQVSDTGPMVLWFFEV